ncbi:MAG: ferric reductase-like transmembrane domain-containing protein [Pseudomonadota bacterium]
MRALGVAHLGLGANPVAALTDSLGLWALRLLLLTLTLTPLRYLTGLADWIRLRRMLGLFAFFYATLHLAMYFLVDQRFAIKVLVEDVTKRPWITLGVVAYSILLVLALTSNARAMRALGRAWQTLHYAVYAAAAGACWHYYWQVKRDVTAPLAYAAVFALLMALRAWRIARRRSKPFLQAQPSA